MLAMAEWWESAAAAIVAYTGMAPEAFFTAVAVAAALYVAISFSGRLAREDRLPARRRKAEDDGEERAVRPLPPPVQIGEVTEEELRESTTGPTRRNRCSWPSRAKSTTSRRAGTCFLRCCPRCKV
jgi:membrane-associated progesterone receptor component